MEALHRRQLEQLQAVVTRKLSGLRKRDPNHSVDLHRVVLLSGHYTTSIE